MKRSNFEGRKTQRREDAEVRSRRRESLSPAEQLKLLDARLGKNKGAKAERARLKKAMQ